MNEFKVVMAATMLDVLDQAGVLNEVVNKAVNGTDKDGLGWHDETDIDRAIVCAAFQVLGHEVADHAHPIVTTIIVHELVNLRDSAIKGMRDIPR